MTLNEDCLYIVQYITLPVFYYVIITYLGHFVEGSENVFLFLTESLQRFAVFHERLSYDWLVEKVKDATQHQVIFTGLSSPSVIPIILRQNGKWSRRYVIWKSQGPLWYSEKLHIQIKSQIKGIRMTHYEDFSAWTNWFTFNSIFQTFWEPLSRKDPSSLWIHFQKNWEISLSALKWDTNLLRI